MESGLHVIGAIQRKTNHERNIMYGSWAVILSYYPILSLCPKPVREEQKVSFNQWEKELKIPDQSPASISFLRPSLVSCPGRAPRFRAEGMLSCPDQKKLKMTRNYRHHAFDMLHCVLKKKIVLGQNNLIFGSRHLILPAIKDKMLMI